MGKATTATRTPSRSSLGRALVWVLLLPGSVATAQDPASIAAQYQALDQVIGYLDGNDPDSGLIAVDQVMGRLQQVAEPEVLYYLHSFRSEQLYYHGLFDEAIKDALAAEQLAHRLGDSLLVANALNLQGLIHENIGGHREALPYLQAALAWYPARAVSRYSVTLPHHIHGNLGQSLAALGRHDSAVVHLRHSRQLAVATNVPRGIAIADWSLGNALLAQGAVDSAIHHLERALRLALDHAQTDVVLELHTALADAWTARGDRRRALELLRQGQAIADTHAVTPVSRRSFHKRAAQLYERAGLTAAALEAMRVANRLDSAIHARNTASIIRTVRDLNARETELELRDLEASLYAEALERARLGRLMVIIGSAVAVLVVLGLYLGYRSRQRHLRRMADLEVLRAQQEATIAELRVREQVGRDMHDDLGAGLSGLKLKSEVALRTETDPERRARLQEIAERSGELIAAMRQIIWALNKEQGSLKDLVTYATGYARNYLHEHGLLAAITEEASWPELQLTSDQRRNLFLVLKECLHNVVKHAGAQRVELVFRLQGGTLELVIADDGVGLSAQRSAAGNGMHNMRARMQHLGGTFQIESGPGTRVRCSMPLSHERSIVGMQAAT